MRSKGGTSHKPNTAIWERGQIMEQKPCSKKKLVSYLKSAKVDTTTMDNDSLYLYSAGRNILADAMIVAICTGEFDEGGK